MKKNVILDEEAICKEYLDTQIGVESLGLKYHVGKLRIKELLAKHNIEIKKRGKQCLKVEKVVDDWRTNKYEPVDSKHYIAVDRQNGFTTRDYENKAGVLTTYISKEYNVEVPTLYFRRRYYMETGNYWWEQWFDIKLVDNMKTKRCPYCDWETIDVENISGWFETHLRKEHDISPEEHLSKYPMDEKFFKKYKTSKEREERLEKEGEYVVCPLCNKRFNKLTESHMINEHGLSLEEFREKYPQAKIMSDSAVKQVLDYNFLGNLTVSKKRFVSVYERELQDFLKKNNIDFSPNRQILIGKEIDLLIENNKLGIEFDGLKFHTEFFGRKDPDYHLNKTIRCNEKGYSLIHIFEDEYVNHREIVYEKLKKFLNINEGKTEVNTVNCLIKEVDETTAKNFLDEYHIRGFIKSDYYIGMFYNDVLLGIMTFKKYSNKENLWEITRFATNHNYILGDINCNLLEYFLKKENPSEIYTFGDRRWILDINNNIYTKMGFVISEIGKPNCTYYNEKIDRFGRYTKEELYEMNQIPLTSDEAEMTRELGYDRIWDCGLIKYVYRNEKCQETNS